VLRPAGAAEDRRCGRLAAAALLASGCADRLPHARPVFADVSPLPCQGQRIVAEWDATLVGFTDVDPGKGRVRYLFVDPRFQGQGVGSALLRAAEAALGGAVSLSVLAVNDRALRWYVRRGYQIVGAELDEDWHGGPAVWLELEKPQRPLGL
jgi:ribosomal protein S18 acetylase RimI-like enzyme